MHHTGTKLSILAMLTAMSILLGSGIITGCSNADNSAVVPDIARANETGNSRGLWGIYAWDYDEAARTIDAIPLRDVEMHVNVTGYLEPPECNDCLQIKVAGVENNPDDMWVYVTMRNPTMLDAYDVRGIFLDENEQILLMDPTARTPVWDWHYPKWHNAFHPFMRYHPERKFGQGIQTMVTYRLRLPASPNFNSVRYIVDASWPGNCKEPYEFPTINSTGPLGTLGSSKTNLACTLLDWQLDPAGVQIDITPLGYPSPVWMDYEGGLFTYELQNTYTADVGKYILRFTAYDQVVTDVISYDLPVYVSDDKFPPTWPGPNEGIIEAISGDASAEIIYGYAQDLTSPDVKYIIYYDNTYPWTFADAHVITDVGKSPVKVYGLLNGYTHAFRVRAMDGAGNIDFNSAVYTVKIGE